MFVRGDGHVPPLQSLYDGLYVFIHRSLHYLTLRICDKGDKESTLRLKPCTDPYSATRTAQGPGSPSASGVFPRPGPQHPAVCTLPHSSLQNRAGNRFPLAICQGFLHAPPPFSTTPPLSPLATAECRPD
jgi:hypothetical protein